MERFYKYVNASVMPLWLAMILAPNHPLTERASRSSILLGLGSVNYLIALLAALRGNDGGEMPDFTNLDGLARGLGTRAGALGAWSHMAALDLFTGAWIYRQSRRLNAPTWVRVPALLFTLFTGPFGLLLFLIWRAVGRGKGEALPGFEM